MLAGTDFQALKRMPGTRSHQHGAKVIHVHPDQVHHVYKHRHDYGDIHGGLSYAYTAKMDRILGSHGSDRFGPEHTHLDHIDQAEAEQVSSPDFRGER